MYEYRQFYIDGEWVDPIEPHDFQVVNPATEEPVGVISLGTAADLDRAVAAVRRAFETCSQSTREERIELLGSILVVFKQIVCKVAPALAAGCTMVLKPSEVAPLNACVFAQVLHEAGVPPGVFNLVNGDGAGVGTAIASHPDIDMVSFTGSTRAGIQVARNAAESVKRVHEELGGKSLNILLDDADLERARKVASRLRAGMVHINGAPLDNDAPFGGYKQSGNGREWGEFGLEEFFEIKAVMGYQAPAA